MNGREVQTVHNLGPWGASPGPILIGAQREDGLFFNGDVGEVLVYRRALNSAEVGALSNREDDSSLSTKMVSEPKQTCRIAASK